MFSDIFKRLFGETSVTYRGLHQVEENSLESSFGLTGLPSSVEADLRQRYLSDDDENDVNPRGQPNGMLADHYYQLKGQPMNEMFNEIQQMFQSLMDPHMSDGFFSFDQEIPLENDDLNPRSRMLDENREITIANPPNHWFPHLNLPDVQNYYHSPDKDLDDDVSKGHLCIDKILQPKDGILNRHGDASSYSFSSVTTTRRSDGCVERKTTKRDSAGNEEMFVERSIGDKGHSIKRKVDKSGTEETVEKFINMDDVDSKEFKQKWQDLRGESSLLTSDATDSLPFDNPTGLYDNMKQFFGL